jgi:CheY-like chemotaxis protein
MKKKILVIDDAERLPHSVALLWGKWSDEVRGASRDEEALSLIEKEDYDLILSDIRMPGKNGVETLLEIQTLLEQKGRKRIPVVFLTGFADREIEEEALSLKPVAYIFKPFDTPKLLEIIESAVAEN